MLLDQPDRLLYGGKIRRWQWRLCYIARTRRVARQEDSRSGGALGVLRFSRRLVLVIICFGDFVPVRGIRCYPMFVILCCRCRVPV